MRYTLDPKTCAMFEKVVGYFPTAAVIHSHAGTVNEELIILREGGSTLALAPATTCDLRPADGWDYWVNGEINSRAGTAKEMRSEIIRFLS